MTKHREKLAAVREEVQQLAERQEDLAAAVEQLETCSDAKQKVHNSNSSSNNNNSCCIYCYQNR